MTRLPKRTGSANIISAIATAKIWGLATGMLAICIPLSKATDSGVILPMAVISGATVSTVAVWKFSDQQNEQLKEAEQVKQLEARVADLETIIASSNIR
ncbi:MAG: hypothetical protein ACFB4I_00905 [Cyanophyceae cyanobacterium]